MAAATASGGRPVPVLALPRRGSGRSGCRQPGDHQQDCAGL